jgi:hypothetical protein
MSTKRNFLLKIGILGFTITILTSAGAQDQSRRPSRGPQAGVQCLSWTQQRRGDFVDAYLAGYLGGKSDACIAAAEIFEVGKTFSDPREDVSQRCFRQAKSYSRETSDYVTVLTEFYTKYPQFRNIPYLYLMMMLRDDEYKTADGIYQMALKGEIRTRF